MVKGKIFYDDVIRTREEWEKYLGQFRESSRQVDVGLDLDRTQYFDILQSHYFVIFHNNPPGIRTRIRQQIKSKIGIEPIAEEAILDSGASCEVYRVSVSREIEIYRKGILDKQSAWVRMKDLHSKGPRAIRNLIERLGSG